MLRFDNVTHLSLLFKFVLSIRLSNSLWGSDVSLFLEFINTVSILLYSLYPVYSKEHVICLISFSKFSDVLHAFACASVVGNISSICLRLNILSRVAKSERCHFPFVAFIENIPLLKALRVNSRPS